jgi:signal transduction histidine kinase
LKVSQDQVEGPFGRKLRAALIVGLAGMLGIFLLAGVDAIRLLRDLQAQDKISRDAARARSQSLSSIRSYVVLSNTYFSDCLLNPDAQGSANSREELESAWTRMQGLLISYKITTSDEQALIGQLQQLLQQHRRQMLQVLSERDGDRYRGVLPVRATMFDITTRVEDIDAKQSAFTEAGIERQFEGLSRQLALVLNIALGAALLLAAGCLIYILRIERQSRSQYREILSARGELERLSARLVAAHEEERRKISRELHDEVGQTLSAVLVDTANLAQRIPSDDAAAQLYLDNIRTHADASVNSIRDIALLLRPSMLDDLGLIPALEWQAREVSRRGNVKVKVLAENVPDSLDDPIRTCIYRLVQESLRNVSSHSQAKHATVTVRGLADALSLTVEDDGIGFDPARTRGLGLLGMEERVKQLGGHLRIESQPGKGTALRVELPMAQPVTR